MRRKSPRLALFNVGQIDSLAGFGVGAVAKELNAPVAHERMARYARTAVPLHVAIRRRLAGDKVAGADE